MNNLCIFAVQCAQSNVQEFVISELIRFAGLYELNSHIIRLPLEGSWLPTVPPDMICITGGGLVDPPRGADQDIHPEVKSILSRFGRNIFDLFIEVGTSQPWDGTANPALAFMAITLSVHDSRSDMTNKITTHALSTLKDLDRRPVSDHLTPNRLSRAASL